MRARTKACPTSSICQCHAVGMERQHSTIPHVDIWEGAGKEWEQLCGRHLH